ncbi:MAG: hypothetical protein ACK4FA_01890 [Candidatus Paceibacteria bacterium]
MTWAMRRQLMYIGTLVLLFGGIGFWIGYPHLNKPPTCADGKKNGDELGVDCGGSCKLACIATVDELKVIWSRAFTVVPGRYNAVAYVENQNKNAGVVKLKYRFRFADKNNIYIGAREGETTIPPSGKFAVFEPAVDLGSSVPVYTSFEFTERPVWVQIPEEKIRQSKLVVQNITISDEGTIPKLEATLVNPSFMTIPNVEVVALLYDNAGNAIATSQTYLASIGPEENVPLVFTWRAPFSAPVVIKEIIPIFNIGQAKIR